MAVFDCSFKNRLLIYFHSTSDSSEMWQFPQISSDEWVMPGVHSCSCVPLQTPQKSGSGQVGHVCHVSVSMAGCGHPKTETNENLNNLGFRISKICTIYAESLCDRNTQSQTNSKYSQNLWMCTPSRPPWYVHLRFEILFRGYLGRIAGIGHRRACRSAPTLYNCLKPISK